MNKIKTISLGFLISVLFFKTVNSEEMYVGIDYLNNEIDTGVTNISSTLDEKDSGFSLYAGFPIDEGLDVEIGYNDFGEASLSGVNGNQFRVGNTTYQFTTTATIAVTSSSISYGVVPKMPLTDGIDLYGKIGLHTWDTEFSVVSTNNNTTLDDEGTDVYFGFGVSMDLDDITGRIGYSSFDVDGDEISSLNIGISAKF